MKQISIGVATLTLPSLHGSTQMENPTKASMAKLTRIIATAATSMMESRLRSNAMMGYLGGSRATALI
jgi:hypothetical protein